MKKLSGTLFLIVFIISSINTHCKAQVNLELNDFKYIKLTGPITESGISVIDTIHVPIGKVWKIVSAGGSRKDSSTSVFLLPTNNALIFIDDVRISDQPVGSPGEGFQANGRLPMWLPTGRYTIKLGGLSGNSPIHTFYGFVNAIE